MMKTYTELLNTMERNSTHTKVLGRRSELDVGNMTHRGIASIMAKAADMTAEGRAEGEDENDETQTVGREEVEEEMELFEEDLMLDDL